MSTLREAYEEGKSVLAGAGIVEAAIDTRLLLEHVMNIGTNDLYAHGDMVLPFDKLDRYRELIELRSRHVPLQHITGHQEFMGLDFYVNDKVLIPRQDTECLVEEAMIDIDDNMRVLDMCTGSGCIIVSLAKYKNNLEAVAVDISPAALEVAKKNAADNGVNVSFICSDLFAELEDEVFDVIVSNPPYIESAVCETLMPEVKEHEPRIALDGDEDGLRYYREIIGGMDSHLVSGGRFYFEIGYNQGEAVSKLLTDKGYTDISVVKDLAGLDRVVKGRKKCLIN